jgi:hypothetical protein
VQSQSIDRPLEDRYRALRSSYSLLKELSDREPTATRLVSLARAAKDLGMRGIAVSALGHAANEAVQRQGVDLSEPFLAPNARFEQLDAGGNLAKWFFAGVLEELERLGEYSSFFSGEPAVRRLQAIQSLGFEGEEMQRRRRLMQARANSHSIGTISEFQRQAQRAGQR